MKNSFIKIVSVMLVMGLAQAKAESNEVKNDNPPGKSETMNPEAGKVKELHDRLESERNLRKADQKKVEEAREKLHEDRKSGASAEQIKSDREALEGARKERHKDQKEINETRKELHEERKERHENRKEHREEKREKHEGGKKRH